MKPRSEIFIIESVGRRDLEADRCEGRALTQALSLAGLASSYQAVTNRLELVTALDEIQRRLGPFNREEIVVPMFHLSAHGNTDGIELTEGDFVAWDELRLMLWQVGDKTGRLNKDGHALAHITMSSCKGIYGAQMIFHPQSPAVSLIGAEEDLSWSDALTAWIVFYHLILVKDYHPGSALPIVNQAAGVDCIGMWGANKKSNSA